MSVTKMNAPSPIHPLIENLEANRWRDDLVQRLESQTATIGIFGLGYVGLPLMLRFVAAGFQVLAFDIDIETVESLNSVGSHIEHIKHGDIERARERGFQATNDLSKAAEPDPLIICVP